MTRSEAVKYLGQLRAELCRPDLPDFAARRLAAACVEDLKNKLDRPDDSPRLLAEVLSGEARW